MQMPGTHAALRVVSVVDGLVFFAAAVMNFGFGVSLGTFDARFGQPIWQAGLGEAVIGLALLIAGATGRVLVGWIALILSVLGIVFGLSSHRVLGEARDIHVVLVPLAIVLLVLLVIVTWRRPPAVVAQD